MSDRPINRRTFLKKGIVGLAGFAACASAVRDFLGGDLGDDLRVGFRNDAPGELSRFSKEASWYEAGGRLVYCTLCPHRCVLGENDRGFCRSRVAKKGKLYTVAYGNPCSVHVDPIEKKPLFHFIPGTPILSIATGGCNLRCLNCQNWQISQARPEDTKTFDLMPAKLAELTAAKRIPSLAYTYSEPVIFYEYVRETSELARARGVRNVLVTAGYIEEAPLREICGVTDAANLDIKGFNDAFYKKISGARLEPVLRCLEIMREENVWVEVTRLIIPTVSDDMEDIRNLCRWMATGVGPDVPLHFSRFYGDYQMKNLPLTPAETLTRAREIALEEGLRHVYVGNLPGGGMQDTFCPKCGDKVIERRGFRIVFNKLIAGRCPCGEAVAGVWA